MLIEFRFRNYRSFRDDVVLSMEATGLGCFKNSLITYNNTKILPGVAIFGKNGGGKSNVIRAFWLAVQFIKNAQRTQHENAPVPVDPFMLNDTSPKLPSEFEFIYTIGDIKYWYTFGATREKIIMESLYHAPKGQKALVFSRENQRFSFTEDKPRRRLISETVAENQLFFSIACTMNDAACVNAMKWFRERLFFSRDYADIPKQLVDFSNDENMLKAISDYAKAADLGIEDIEYKLDSEEVEYRIDGETAEDTLDFPKGIPEGVKAALAQFVHTLSEVSDNSEAKLKLGQVKATPFHQGQSKDGSLRLYPLELSDESDGTRKLMSIAPAIESALKKGGVLLVDELERELHPMLVNFILAKFQSKAANPNGAQIIFTTHNTELMNMEFLRKDQIYFTDKNREDGSTELYSISEFATKTAENIRKGYLLGKYGAIPDIEIEEVE